MTRVPCAVSRAQESWGWPARVRLGGERGLRKASCFSLPATPLTVFRKISKDIKDRAIDSCYQGLVLRDVSGLLRISSRSLSTTVRFFDSGVGRSRCTITRLPVLNRPTPLRAS
ncbi:hypothetical protein BDM02DRAFT_1857415 [Thelephora ganbajun]|uniref:Uncharacterized protein n=1 Tax=Thelephora ganbajun TaxID=370292 RepID=A0ACB6YZP5_THEGA|nr:hypothetical protein BDM02DRAFT_1857415 [Thelephora ganbajun]